MSQDIWDEFEKMAVAQGLISVSADDEEQPKSKVRYDSLADDAIRLLYNIEPEPEGKKSIIEYAHPDTFVVGRAYDAMNAIIENEQQHQNMMAYIALKMPNGNLTQRRYVAAKKDLLDSLIRSAFVLDNQNEENLMVLADSCAQRLDKQEIKKEAMPAVAIAGAAAALLGLGYYFFAGAPPAEGVYQNAQKVINALTPLSDRSYAASIQADMAVVMNMAKQVYAVKAQLIPIHSVDDSVTEAQKGSEKSKIETAHKILTNYMEQLIKIRAAIPKWTSAIRIMATEDTEERGDWSAKLHALTHSFTDTPEETLIYALEGKADAFSALKQIAPGNKENTSGGLLGSISQELVKFQGAVQAVKEKVPEIHDTLNQQISQPQEKKQLPKDAPIAQNTQPSMADINQDLFNTMGLNG
jgi:hypothetical protein